MKVPIAGDRALVVLLPHALRLQVDRWRRLYDPNHNIIPPHITVAYPPFVPEEEWPSVRPEVVECMGHFAPFHVELRGTGWFAGEPSYLWLRPEDDGSLARIHATLAEHFPHYVQQLPFEYQCHLTIGVFDSQERLREAEARILAEWEPCHFEVQHLVYMSLEAHGLWCVCGQIPLGQSDSNAE